MNQERGLFPKPYLEPASTNGIIRARYELEVPPRYPILVNDINGLLCPGVSPRDVDDAVRLLVAGSFRPDAAYLVAQSFEPEITMFVTKQLQNGTEKNTAVIFPCDGARAVLRETLGNCTALEGKDSYFIPTARIVDNGRVRGVSVSLPESLRFGLEAGRYDSMLVIEDVIATGSTLKELQQKIQEASSKPLVMRAVSWFCRLPTDISGFASIDAVYRYWTPEGYPPLNTLSTWLRTDEKGLIVRELFAQKYCKYPIGFRKQIQYIRSLTTQGGSYD